MHDLLGKVVLTSQQVNKERIVHRDLRLPNMCFDEKYNSILIDLDFSVHHLPEEVEKMNIIELQTFAKDLFDKLEGMDQIRTGLEQLEKTERPERYTGTERFTPKETERWCALDGAQRPIWWRELWSSKMQFVLLIEVLIELVRILSTCTIIMLAVS